MPIRPEDKLRYPKNWKEIRARTLERAGNRCEWCGVPNGTVGYREDDGTFFELAPEEIDVAMYDGEKVIKIVLTIAHLDHTPENCADENLAALCQRCHLGHDAKQHRESRARNRERLEIARGQSMIFSG